MTGGKAGRREEFRRAVYPIVFLRIPYEQPQGHPAYSFFLAHPTWSAPQGVDR